MRFRPWACLAAATIFGAALAQECFYAANKVALDQYIPCSAGPGIVSCCLAGDFCLSEGACYSPGTNLTYVAGCTDQSFQDSSCRGGTGSCNKDTQFQALAVCGSNWVCCSGRGQLGTIPNNDYDPICPCTLGYPTVISEATTLSQIASLPNSYPTTPRTLTSPPSSSTPAPSSSSPPSSSPSSTASSPASSSAVSSSASASASGSASPGSSAGGTTSPPTPGPGLTPTGAPSNDGAAPSSGDDQNLKIGLGVGISLGVAFLILIGTAYWLWRRRQREKAFITQEDLSTAVWQGETAAGAGPRRMPATEATAYHSNANPVVSDRPKSGGGAPAMRETRTPPPQYPPSSPVPSGGAR